MSTKKVAEEYYSPPPKLGKWEGFKQFLWNSETSQCLGRTGSSWAKILLFYVLYYAALTGFFSALLAVFYQTLDYKTPKWQLDSSLIGSNPGLGFRPMPPESNAESTLIWYNSLDPNNYKHWVDELDNFLETYHDPTHKDNRVKCSFDNPPPEGKVCEQPLDNLQPCTKENKYNFHKAEPCIFLKLNKIFNWLPEIFDDPKNLPKHMPKDLQEHITEEALRGNKNTQIVWVSCEGENPADTENIGVINYKPRRGFPAYFFPFKNIEGYQQPLVAVLFEQLKRGVLINIECKAWAKNIAHDRADRRGSVHFEIMID